MPFALCGYVGEFVLPQEFPSSGLSRKLWDFSLFRGLNEDVLEGFMEVSNFTLIQ